MPRSIADAGVRAKEDIEHRNGPRARALPAADTARAQCLPWSIADAGVRAKEDIGHRNRKQVDPIYIKRPKPKLESFVLALPIFTASRPATIVGAHVLNFCVRNGNRWTHMAIKTNYSFISKLFS